MHELHTNKHDLRALARLLEAEFAGRPPVGAVVGKTMMRDAIMSSTGCSVLHAERAVDQLEAYGYLQLHRPRRAGAIRRARPTWQITSSPTMLN